MGRLSDRILLGRVAGAWEDGGAMKESAGKESAGRKRTKRFRRVRMAEGLFSVFCLAGALYGATPLHPEEVLDFQREVRTQLENLQHRLKDVADRLEKISPEDAAKTRKVAEELTRRDVLSDMTRVIELLSQRKFATAAEGQDQVIQDLRAIIRFLEGRKLGTEDWKAQLDRIRSAGRKVRNLLSRQRALRAESESPVESQKEAASITNLEKEIEGVLARQEKLSRKLPQGPLPGEEKIGELARRVEELASRQASLRDQVTKAPGAKELEEIRKTAAALARKLEKGASEGKSAGEELRKELESLARRAEKALGDPDLAASLDKAARGGLSAAENRKSAVRALRRVEKKSERGAPLASLVPRQAELEVGARGVMRRLGELKNVVGKNDPALKQASEALKQASGEMARASRALKRAGKKEAAEAQDAALNSLAKARSALKSLERGVGKRDKFARAEAVERELARKTKQLEEAARRLERKLRKKTRSPDGVKEAAEALRRAGEAMSKAAGEFGRRRESSGTRQAGAAAKELAAAKQALRREALKRLKRHDLENLAARQDEVRKEAEKLARELRRGEESALRRAGGKVGSASGQMGKASENFRSGRASEGASAQERAMEDLAQAERDLAREEEELQRLRQEQQITDMVELLIKIRDGQKEIYLRIKSAEDARDARGRLPRKTLRLLQKLGRTQRDLIRKAETVRKLLQDEDARVFAFVVEDILGDMEQLTEAITERDTGRFTQILAASVVRKVERLLEALRSELAQRRRNQKQKQQNAQGRMRLIPPVAEALMLKRMQESINERTKDVERARKANAGRLTPAMERQLKRLALQQGSLATLTKKLARDFFGLMPQEEDSAPQGEKKKTEGR